MTKSVAGDVGVAAVGDVTACGGCGWEALPWEVVVVVVVVENQWRWCEKRAWPMLGALKQRYTDGPAPWCELRG